MRKSPRSNSSFGFVDHDAAVQTLSGEVPVDRWQVFERGGEPLEGWSASELVDHVAIGTGDDEGAPDRSASL